MRLVSTVTEASGSRRAAVALDLAQEVVDLAAGGADLDRRVDEGGRADHLFDETRPGRGSISQGPGVAETCTVCGRMGFPFLEAQWAVVEAGGQAEAVFGESRLAAEIAFVHGADLRHRDMALVGEHQGVVGQIFEQGREAARRASRPVR